LELRIVDRMAQVDFTDYTGNRGFKHPLAKMARMDKEDLAVVVARERTILLLISPLQKAAVVAVAEKVAKVVTPEPEDTEAVDLSGSTFPIMGLAAVFMIVKSHQ